jgi:BirA family biotin operon repressor/biotin-[acetyl-CoA-carboxylase] ligase
MKFKIFRFKKVKSTNNTAIRIIKGSNCKYGMVISDTQTMGRGQYGKKWISHKGNLFVSFFHDLKNINLSLTRLTKINCLLIKKLLTNYYKKNIIFKKPNDLLVQKKKISGILQETVSILDNKFLIIGIGINIKKSPKIKDYLTTCID